MGLILYQLVTSPACVRVRLLAAAKGLTLDTRPVPGQVVGGLPGETDSAEFLAMNPTGGAPVLDHDGTIVTEADVICEYLEDVFPERTLRPPQPAQLAKVRTMTRLLDLHLAPQLLKMHLELDPATRNEAVVDEGFRQVGQALDYISHFLEGPRYAIGGTLSQADCAIAPYFFFIYDLGPVAFDRASAVTGRMKTYRDEILQDPFVAAAYEEMHADLAKTRAARAEAEAEA